MPGVRAQTAEMQKTLEGLKGAVAALEQGKAAKSGPTDGEALTVKELRSELRAMATSLNECGAPPLCCLFAMHYRTPVRATQGHWVLCNHTQALLQRWPTIWFQCVAQVLTRS